MEIKIDVVTVDAERMRYNQWHDRKRQFVTGDEEYDIYLIEGKFYYAENDDPYSF